MEQLTGFGPHLMLDLVNVKNTYLLDDLELCFNLLDTLPPLIGMTKITQPYVFPYKGLVPEDEGITGMVIIAESHISIHTFPRKSYAFIDIFSCKPFDEALAIKTIKDRFFLKNKNVIVNRVDRGLTFPR